MAMISTSGAATPTATVLATAASLTPTIPEALQSDIMPPADMQMQGMSSFIHFGLGDLFFAGLLTPTQASGYVAVMLFLMMLNFRPAASDGRRDKGRPKLAPRSACR